MKDIKGEVVTICRKDSYKFKGRPKGSTGWYNLDHDFLRRRFSTLEPDFYKNYKKDIESVNMEPYRNFFVTFDYNKLNLFNWIVYIKKV